MRKWGLVISLFYAVIVLGMLIPLAVLLSGASEHSGWQGLAMAVRGARLVSG